MTSSKKVTSYGATFRARRLQLHLTQSEVARRMGITQVSISMFEKQADHTARTITLIRYAAALDTTVEELFGA